MFRHVTESKWNLKPFFKPKLKPNFSQLNCHPGIPELLNYRLVQSTLGLDEVDEEVGGSVVGGDRSTTLHLWLDGLGELLAKFHPVNWKSK